MWLEPTSSYSASPSFRRWSDKERALDLSNEIKCTLNLAHYQHAGLDLKHPNGGQALYQEQPLYSNVGTYLGQIAEAVLDTGVDAAMIDVVEQFASDTGAATPKELTLLAHSDHPTVTSNGAVIYDRAPEVPRLSESELRELHRAGIEVFRRRRG